MFTINIDSVDNYISAADCKVTSCPYLAAFLLNEACQNRCESLNFGYALTLRPKMTVMQEFWNLLGIGSYNRSAKDTTEGITTVGRYRRMSSAFTRN